MAVLTVIFATTQSDPWGPLPVIVGSGARTQRIAITTGTDAESTATTLTAGQGDKLALLRADIDCFVAVGEDPEAVVPAVDGDEAGVIPLFADEWRELTVSAGYKVAVVGAA